MGYHLCETPHADPCTVLAEMMIYLPQSTLASLDAELTRWQNRDPNDTSEIIESPAHTTINGHAAIEAVTKGRHSDHFSKIVTRSTIVFQTNSGFVKCYGNSSPEEYFAFKPVFHEFCANFDFSTLKPD